MSRRRVEHEYDVRDCGYETPCWVSAYKPSSQGYVSLHLPGGGRGYAHRVMYERLVGPIPEGLDLDHLCRNRVCCNPEHLEPVTRAENLRRGRGTKLTAEDVEAIKASSDTTVELGRRFGVHYSHISRIKTGKWWVAV